MPDTPRLQTQEYVDLSEKMSFRVTDPAPEPVVLTPEEAAIFKAMEEEEFRLKNVELQQMLSALEGGKPPQTRGVYMHTYLQYMHTYIHVVRVNVIYVCVYIYYINSNLTSQMWFEWM